MLYLYGDESNTPGADEVWAGGFLFSTNPKIHMEFIQKLRRECSYLNRELKYSSTDYSQILFAVRLIDYFLNADDLYFKVIIKDNLFFSKEYFDKNYYKLDKKDMAYVSAYAELSKSIKVENFEQNKKANLKINLYFSQWKVGCSQVRRRIFHCKKCFLAHNLTITFTWDN